MKVFMFPGQGSQAKGMGGSLFDKFKDLTNKADEILGYSIKDLCLNDPQNLLNKTQFTQPALYVVNALSYYEKTESEKSPDFVLGHSLGEYNALLASECFDFETGLRLVQKRGELMSQATNGGMVAILNAPKDEIMTILKENNLNGIDIANYNTSSQIVISGDSIQLEKAQPFFQGGNIAYIPLNTSGAFHSRFMRPASVLFKDYLSNFTFHDLKIPVISNISGLPYQKGSIINNLSEQIVGSVLWRDSIKYLLQFENIEFEEVGYGDVLSKLVAKIKAEPTVRTPMANIERFSWSDIKGGLSAEEKVAIWNKNVQVGSRVKSTIISDENLVLRSQATVLFGHRAAVYINNYNGYFDLDELTLD